jgi:hypothetical protein
MQKIIYVQAYSCAKKKRLPMLSNPKIGEPNEQ